MSNHPEVELGKIITKRFPQKDAIHIAVAPVIAATKLSPGDHVGFVNKSENTVGKTAKCIGIVDPFLKKDINTGETFYLCLYPNTILSLRHEWLHPEFSKKDEQEQDEKYQIAAAWLKHFADNIGVDLEDVVGRASDYINYGQYWCEGGRFEGEYVPDEFWEYYEIYTGTKVKEDDRGSFFTCSC